MGPSSSQPAPTTNRRLHQLLLSVDVLRFEPHKTFQHYTKTTKAAVDRYELYAISCEQLSHPLLELPGTGRLFMQQLATAAAAAVVGPAALLLLVSLLAKMKLKQLTSC